MAFTVKRTGFRRAAASAASCRITAEPMPRFRHSGGDHDFHEKYLLWQFPSPQPNLRPFRWLRLRNSRRLGKVNRNDWRRPAYCTPSRWLRIGSGQCRGAKFIRDRFQDQVADESLVLWAFRPEGHRGNAPTHGDVAAAFRLSNVFSQADSSPFKQMSRLSRVEKVASAGGVSAADGSCTSGCPEGIFFDSTVTLCESRRRVVNRLQRLVVIVPKISLGRPPAVRKQEDTVPGVANIFVDNILKRALILNVYQCYGNV